MPITSGSSSGSGSGSSSCGGGSGSGSGSSDGSSSGSIVSYCGGNSTLTNVCKYFESMLTS